MPERRLLELALRGLEAERKTVEEEIAEIKRQLSPGTSEPRSGTARGKPTKVQPVAKKRRVSAAVRNAARERMKAYWAKKKAMQKKTSAPLRKKASA